MKIWMILLIGLIAASCANQPRVELPDWDLAARGDTVEAANPMVLPQLCVIPWESTDVACWSALDGYDIVSEGNYVIAQANTDALRKAEAGYDHIVEAGKMQQELSQIRQELLEEERRGRMMDKWYYRGIITLGLIAVGVSQ